MLFKKAPAATAPQPRSFAWEQVDRQTQSLWVTVGDWQYKVFPNRQSKSFGNWLFQFEGVCRTTPLRDLVAVGEVETLDRDETPGMLSDRWRSVPDSVEGYASLMESDDPIVPASFGVTLYCQESALDWIYRAFTTGAGSRSGAVSLELTLDCPNNQGGAFWEEQWRTECLRVVSWKVFAGAQLNTQK